MEAAIEDMVRILEPSGLEDWQYAFDQAALEVEIEFVTDEFEDRLERRERRAEPRHADSPMLARGSKAHLAPAMIATPAGLGDLDPPAALDDLDDPWFEDDDAVVVVTDDAYQLDRSVKLPAVVFAVSLLVATLIGS